MKAVLLDRYGPPEDLRVEETETPTPEGREVLIRIHAAAVNDYDWCMVRGKPHAYRLLFGLTRPKARIPGMEAAGVVEACGPDASRFQPGDAVYGDISDYGFGALAEFVLVDDRAVRRKPEGMTFQEAAAFPHAAVLAYQGLEDAGGVRAGQSVLINGAGGGVGTFALQLAKQHDAEVTGVDSAAKADSMRSLGFDHVIDYRRDDFTRNGRRYDVILDAKTTRSPFAHLRSLKPGGAYVTVGGTVPRILQTALLGRAIERFSDKKVRITALKANRDLEYLEGLFEQGVLRCPIDGPYPLERAPEAIRRFGEGGHVGKIVISGAQSAVLNANR